jgi:hypothetical protein
MGTDLLPHAVQMLDFSHAKQYLWEAAKLSYGEGSAFVPPWVKERETLLLADQVPHVITHLQALLDLRPALLRFSTTVSRIRLACAMGPIGSRATSSARARLRVRANNSPLAASKAPAGGGLSRRSMLFSPLRCLFLEQSWQTYWETQGPLAA